MSSSMHMLVRRRPELFLGACCRTTRPARSSVLARASTSGTKPKVLWVETSSKEVYTGCVEAGLTTFLSDDKHTDRNADWKRMAKSEILTYTPAKVTSDIIDDSGEAVAHRCTVNTGAELQVIQNYTQWVHNTIVVDATDWQIIPAENLVAAFQPQSVDVLVYADTCTNAKVLLEALEVGVDGVVLRTSDLNQALELAAYVEDRNSTNAFPVTCVAGEVRSIQEIGMGDRVCVDLCSNLRPGEGLLVGNYSRALFLIHSESAQSSYIGSRPFRVNAGAVHAYSQAPDGKTAYLSELKTGLQVLVVGADGRTRTAVIGRCKIETRPLVLITAVTPDGQEQSVIVQNAETVKLVGTRKASTAVQDTGTDEESQPASDRPKATWWPDNIDGSGASEQASPTKWEAIAVTDMKIGDNLKVYLQDGARHAGMPIVESCWER